MVDYEKFLAQLRRKEAAPLMGHLKGFLARFNSEKRPILQHRKLVASFLHFIYGESLQNPIFAHCTSDDDLENIREGWEKLVMMNIYDRVFGAPETDDLKLGAHLQRKIDSFQWVAEHHLDLPFSFHHTLEVAQAELLRVNGFRAPRDKLIILQNTTQIVVDLIRKALEPPSRVPSPTRADIVRDAPDASEVAEPAGADGDAGAAAPETAPESVDSPSSPTTPPTAAPPGNDFLLPSLILTIIRANPPNLIANIKYIMRFRNQAELDKGANQFCITNMMSAVSFIYNMSPKSLTLSEEEALRYGATVPGGSGRPGEAGSSSSSSRDPAVPQVSQLASKVYTSTSGWFNSLIREAKIFGEQAAGKVDGFVNQVVGDNDEGEGGEQQQLYQPTGYPGNLSGNAAHSQLAPPVPPRPGSSGEDAPPGPRSSSLSPTGGPVGLARGQAPAPPPKHQRRESTPTGEQLRQQLRQKQQQNQQQQEQRQLPQLPPIQPATGPVPAQWFMEHSPTVNPMSPVGGLMDPASLPPVNAGLHGPYPPGGRPGGVGHPGMPLGEPSAVAGPAALSPGTAATTTTTSGMSPAEQEDYELQLAMALSLSTIEADQQRRREIEEEAGLGGDGGGGPGDDAEGDLYGVGGDSTGAAGSCGDGREADLLGLGGDEDAPPPSLSKPAPYELDSEAAGSSSSTTAAGNKQPEGAGNP